MRRVLVIEDDANDAALTRRAALRAGLFPDCVATGEEAISCLLKNTYAYILIEPSLRGLNLPLIISLVNRQDRRAPIVVITKDSTLIGERKLREMGVQHYLVKPASDLELDMVLNNAKSNDL